MMMTSLVLDIAARRPMARPLGLQFIPVSPSADMSATVERSPTAQMLSESGQ